MSIYRAKDQHDKYTAELRIGGYKGGLQELTDHIGLTPTRTINIGERRKPLALPAKESFWEYQIISHEVDTADEILTKLAELVYPRRTILKKLSQECEICLAVGVTTYEYNPEIFLSPEFLAKLSDIGIRVWFDIYSFSETYLEEENQQNAFVTRLQKSKSAKKLGIVTSEEAQALTRALHLYERNKDEIYTDLFPDYAGGEPATEEDTYNSLLLARDKLKELHDAIDKSDFLMSRVK